MIKNGIFSKFDMELGKGLVWVAQLSDAFNDAEVLALAEARKFKADAVYFRRFENENRSVPQVYIYERDFNDEDLVEVHTNLWSSGVVPLFYVVTPTQVKVFNCTKSVEKGRKVSAPLKIFTLAGAVQSQLEYEKFSAKLFDNGTFWEEYPEVLNVANSPYQKLLNGLLRAKKDFEKQKIPLSPTTINKLLIIGLLVRYLEEKEDDQGLKLLQIGRDLYKKFPDCVRFTDILRKGFLIPFLSELDQKFNGKLFDLSELEKQELSNANLDFAAAIFDANIDAHTKQYILWEIYAFNHLPIELISGIYEAFLKKEKGVVYTPPYLVNALIDECMPIDKAEAFFKNENFKVLDPACGSGIFLVAALKRMVQWKAILHYKATGEVAYPDIKTIQRITKNNVFGIDIEEGATLISIFSLCIALCDKLSPMQIWENLRFEDLGEKNIRTADFFKIYHEISKEGFDLVIGNPPFNPPAPFSNKSYLKHVKDNYQVEPSHSLNDDNLALFFWDKAVHLRKEGGKICFILPSGAWLYNNNSIEYRSYFLKQFQVSKIIDFTHLSDKLFHGSANVAVCAVIASDLPETLPTELLHIVVRRSRVAEERFYFEVDHYDFHRVNYKTAIENAFVWKANLLGGGRLLRLVNYLGNLRSLGAYLEEMKAEKGWVYGEGYIIGRKSKTETTQFVFDKKVRKFRDNIFWITDKKTIDTKSFTEDGKFKWFIQNENLFEKPRSNTRAIFEAPHILIKETLGQRKIPMAFSEEYLCFQNEVFGVHAPKNQKELLFNFFNRLGAKSELNRLYLLSTSARSGINKSSFPIYAIDIKNLPYPDNPDDLQLGYSETIVQNDVLEYYIKSNTNSEKSPLNQPVSAEALREYGEVFCNILNPIYEQNGQNWFVRGFHEDDAAIAYAFCYGKPASDILPNLFEGGMKGIEHLLQNKAQRNVRIYRVLREYLHVEGYDVLILVKPKLLRYWLKSIALRDADETFSDLKRTGF
jgi:type I restriction-modification system DNA methylase subunit